MDENVRNRAKVGKMAFVHGHHIGGAWRPDGRAQRAGERKRQEDNRV